MAILEVNPAEVGSRKMLKDVSWVSSVTFWGLHQNAVAMVQRYRKGSNGWLKFMDTTLGGNTAINAPYQFCRYADIKEYRLAQGIGKGMGRWYSENIDDWGHNVHFRVGVPAYSGLLSYILKAIDGPTARYVATGRTPGLMSFVGEVLGWVVSAAFFELAVISTAVNFFIRTTTSRFYYLKPAMHQYWDAVQTMVNTMSGALALTLDSPSVSEVTNSGFKLDDQGIDQRLIETVKRNLPDTFNNFVFSVNGENNKDLSISIFNVATRAQALAYQQKRYFEKLMESYHTPNIGEIAFREMQEKGLVQGPVMSGNNAGHLNPSRPIADKGLEYYKKYMNELFIFNDTESNDPPVKGKDINESELAKIGNSQGSAESKLNAKYDASTQGLDVITKPHPEQETTFIDKFMSVAEDGLNWFSLRVSNAMDSVGESFSASSTESEVGKLFNDISQTAQNIKFNLGGGQTGLGVLDKGIQAVTGGVMDALTEVAANSPFLSITTPLIGLFYGAKIDAPKRWSSSSASPVNTTFNLELRAGYGNVISYFQDIIVPLCMCLTLGLPRGTGPQSYSAPFYVQYYSRGRNQVQIGLVTSMTVTRGVGNQPWLKRGLPTGVDVSFTVEDMTSTIFAPVRANYSGLGQFYSSITDNAFSDYIAVLTGLTMQDQEYFYTKARRRFHTMMTEFNNYFQTSRFISKGIEWSRFVWGWGVDYPSTRI